MFTLQFVGLFWLPLHKIHWSSTEQGDSNGSCIRSWSITLLPLVYINLILQLSETLCSSSHFLGIFKCLLPGVAGTKKTEVNLFWIWPCRVELVLYHLDFSNFLSLIISLIQNGLIPAPSLASSLSYPFMPQHKICYRLISL